MVSVAVAQSNRSELSRFWLPRFPFSPYHIHYTHPPRDVRMVEAPSKPKTRPKVEFGVAEPDGPASVADLYMTV